MPRFHEVYTPLLPATGEMSKIVWQSPSTPVYNFPLMARGQGFFWRMIAQFGSTHPSPSANLDGFPLLHEPFLPEGPQEVGAARIWRPGRSPLPRDGRRRVVNHESKPALLRNTDAGLNH
jgi:hypothetical protein